MQPILRAPTACERDTIRSIGRQVNEPDLEQNTEKARLEQRAFFLPLKMGFVF